MQHPLPRTRRASGPKPRILLVDDHQGVLDSVSVLLRRDFEIAATMTSGPDALDRVKDVDPDAIVLDINMPGFNGFDTMRALEQTGSRAPVVFLSMFESEDLMTEAFRCGGRGYVRKAHIPRDLAVALDQVLLGRRFVPSMPMLIPLTPGAGHAMHLHGAPDNLLDDAAVFFDRALGRGDATCIIATADVRTALTDHLNARGWTLGGPGAHERCLLVDADDALDRFMHDGLPDASILKEIATELDQYRRDVTDDDTSRLTILGNMAALLVERGNPAAAIALEHQWRRLSQDLPFFTVCYYPSTSFTERDVWSHVCESHSAVSYANDI